MHERALRNRIDELADDIGRLRRRVEPETSLGFLVDRIACQVETIAGFVHPSAGELAAWIAPGDEEAITEAIRIVDERARRLKQRLAA